MKTLLQSVTHKKLFIAFSISFLLNSFQCFSQAGTLDSSFGANGNVMNSFGYPSLSPSTLAIQQDGKIVVIGTAQVSNPFHEYFIVSRYTTSGNLDPSFGINGVVTTDFDQQEFGSSSPNAVLIQPDGKILVGGSVLSSDLHFEYFALIRYKANGDLDSTFGTNGEAINFPGNPQTVNEISAITLQNDGKIVTGANSDGYCVARYKSNGIIDSSFGVDGLIRNPDTTSYDLKNVFLQSDGKIVTACTRLYSQGTSQTSDFQINRLLPNGNFDSTFGINGFVYTDFNSVSNYLSSIAILPDGGVVAAGITGTEPDVKIAISKYKLNGLLDSSFGVNGKVISSFGKTEASANKIIVQSNGKLIVAGSLLIRLNSIGTIYPTFGIKGKATNFNGAVDAVLQNDGKIVSLNKPYFSLQRFKGDPNVSVQKNITKVEGNTGTTSATFKILLSTASTKKITVNYTTVDGTAKAGQDYVAKSGTLTFSPGQTSKNVAISIIGDKIVEPNEKFSLLLNNPTNAILGTLSTAICTIKNDDLSSVTVTNKIAATSDIKLYPNPTNNILRIEGLNKNTNANISVIDIQGRLISKNNTSNTTYSLDVRQLSVGTYFVKIERGNNITTLKFVKE